MTSIISYARSSAYSWHRGDRASVCSGTALSNRRVAESLANRRGEPRKDQSPRRSARKANGPLHTCNRKEKNARSGDRTLAQAGTLRSERFMARAEDVAALRRDLPAADQMYSRPAERYEGKKQSLLGQRVCCRLGFLC
jgi:hypothetical protein